MPCTIRPGRAVWALAIVFAVAALVPATVQGAAPITIGSGHKPGVALDAAGTAYIAWYGPEPTTSTLRFCRLPRGAATCDIAETIPAPGTSLSRPFVSVTGTTVRVVSYRYGLSGPNFAEVWEFISTDGGQTFDAGRAIGYPAFDEAVVGPGDTLSVATNAVTEGLLFQNMPLDGVGSAGTAYANLSTDHPYNGTVGLVDAATPLVVFANGSSLAQFRRYGGAGSLNDAASWTAPVDIGYADYPRLAGGPSGLFMLAGTESGALVVRRWDGTTFAPGVTISGGGDDAQAHLTQDPAGRLHAVFGFGTAEGLHLIHATSDDGVSWQPGLVFTEAGTVGIGYLRAAAAADHVGVVAWGSTINGTPEIRVAAIGPQVAPGLPPPVLGRTVNVSPVSGRVLVSLPPGAARAAQVKGRTFIPLAQARQVPVGSLLNTRKGKVSIVSATDLLGATQSGDFSAGIFQVLQSRKPKQKGLTELRLKGSGLSRCRAGGKGKRASAARKKLSSATIRRLKANANGNYRSRGNQSAGTARGTVWITADRCDGTLTTVKRGKVAVRDFRRKKTIVVRAGKRYLARATR